MDFYKIFRIHPTAMALLTPELEFIDANDEFLRASGHSLDDLVGHNAFAVLPKKPEEPGHPHWTALEQAQASGQREIYTLTRYDIEDPANPGTYQERYWSTIVTPVRSEDGEVEVLQMSAREVTPIVQQLYVIRNEMNQSSP